MQRLGWLTVSQPFLQTAMPGGGTDGDGGAVLVTGHCLARLHQPHCARKGTEKMHLSKFIFSVQ